MWYHCSEPPGEIVLGNITLPEVKDCPVSGDKLPLVVVSHGRGGSFIGHDDTAEALADAGFVVAAIDHPGSTTFDMSCAGDPSVLVEPPTNIKRLIDFVVGASPAASKIDPDRIGFFGFSLGGYTGLVVIGADPDWAIPLCQRSSAVPSASRSSKKGFLVQPLAHDPRIKAAVIGGPFSDFLTADGFAAIKYRFSYGRRSVGATGDTRERGRRG
jgi:predicted dienelactone hydrolase